jgi:uncharacterized protein (TIGR00304 family)
LKKLRETFFKVSGERERMPSALVFAGVLLVLAGLALVVLGMLSEALLPGGAGDGKAEVRGGGVVFVGPVPIVLATDAATARSLLLITLAATAAAYLLLARR